MQLAVAADALGRIVKSWHAHPPAVNAERLRYLAGNDVAAWAGKFGAVAPGDWFQSVTLYCEAVALVDGDFDKVISWLESTQQFATANGLEAVYWVLWCGLDCERFDVKTRRKENTPDSIRERQCLPLDYIYTLRQSDPRRCALGLYYVVRIQRDVATVDGGQPSEESQTGWLGLLEEAEHLLSTASRPPFVNDDATGSSAFSMHYSCDIDKARIATLRVRILQGARPAAWRLFHTQQACWDARCPMLFLRFPAVQLDYDAKYDDATLADVQPASDATQLHQPQQADGQPMPLYVMVISASFIEAIYDEAGSLTWVTALIAADVAEACAGHAERCSQQLSLSFPWANWARDLRNRVAESYTTCLRGIGDHMRTAKEDWFGIDALSTLERQMAGASADVVGRIQQLGGKTFEFDAASCVDHLSRRYSIQEVVDHVFSPQLRGLARVVDRDSQTILEVLDHLARENGQTMRSLLEFGARLDDVALRLFKNRRASTFFVRLVLMLASNLEAEGFAGAKYLETNEGRTLLQELRHHVERAWAQRFSFHELRALLGNAVQLKDSSELLLDTDDVDFVWQLFCYLRIVAALAIKSDAVVLLRYVSLCAFGGESRYDRVDEALAQMWTQGGKFRRLLVLLVCSATGRSPPVINTPSLDDCDALAAVVGAQASLRNFNSVTDPVMASMPWENTAANALSPRICGVTCALHRIASFATQHPVTLAEERATRQRLIDVQQVVRGDDATTDAVVLQLALSTLVQPVPDPLDWAIGALQTAALKWQHVHVPRDMLPALAHAMAVVVGCLAVTSDSGAGLRDAASTPFMQKHVEAIQLAAGVVLPSRLSGRLLAGSSASSQSLSTISTSTKSSITSLSGTLLVGTNGAHQKCIELKKSALATVENNPTAGTGGSAQAVVKLEQLSFAINELHTVTTTKDLPVRIQSLSRAGCHREAFGTAAVALRHLEQASSTKEQRRRHHGALVSLMRSLVDAAARWHLAGVVATGHAASPLASPPTECLKAIKRYGINIEGIKDSSAPAWWVLAVATNSPTSSRRPDVQREALKCRQLDQNAKSQELDDTVAELHCVDFLLSDRSAPFGDGSLQVEIRATLRKFIADRLAANKEITPSMLNYASYVTATDARLLTEVDFVSKVYELSARSAALLEAHRRGEHTKWAMPSAAPIDKLPKPVVHASYVVDTIELQATRHVARA